MRGEAVRAAAASRTRGSPFPARRIWMLWVAPALGETGWAAKAGKPVASIKMGIMYTIRRMVGS